MKQLNKKMLWPVLIGISMAFLWVNYVGIAIYFVYQKLEFLKFPNFMAVIEIVAVSLIFGAASAAPCLLKAFPLNNLNAVQALTIIIFSIIVLCLYGSGIAGVISQLTSYGFWSFVAGSAIVFSLGAKNAS